MLKKVIKVLKDPAILFRSTCWGVGIVENFFEEDILTKKMDDICWIEGNHAGDFFADPFITDYFGEPIIFFENYFEKENRGNISYIALSELNQTRNNRPINHPSVRTALDLPTHLSYPYLFEYGGELYMVPENYQSHTISLYKSNGSPDMWEKVTTFIDDFDGIDTTIFEHNGKWWMFSTLRVGGTPSQHSELYIWHSNSPLEGWVAHKMNPIKYEEPIARGAGKPFVVGDKLYRPAQDCSRVYGGELLIKEIVTLTTDDFCEKTVKKLSGYHPFEDAFHTYNCCNSVAVIDGTRNKYSIAHAFYLVKSILTKR